LDLAGGYDFNEGGAIASGRSLDILNGILKTCSVSSLTTWHLSFSSSLLVAGCGGLQEEWGRAKIFRPNNRRLASDGQPIRQCAGRYSRRLIQRLEQNSQHRACGVSGECDGYLQASKEAFDTLVFYFSAWK
jgi:hypothetical protein